MRLLLPGIVSTAAVLAQNNFVGAMGGISTLSADARASGSPPEQIVAYKPENGPTAQVFAGRHFFEYFSAQLSYAWNRNDVLLSGADLSTASSFELPARVTMHTVSAEAMVYFRPRASRLRPYLSAGPAAVLMLGEARGEARVRGSPEVPSAGIEPVQAALRAAVGIDLRAGAGFALRYSFSETIQRNPLSRALRPPAERNLANFQNWWGLSWSF